MSKDYEQLLKGASLPVVRKLYERVISKKTNLCVSADLTKAEDIIELAKEVGPYISVLKTHVDIINNFSSHFINTLRSIADDLGFLLFEDRKFADIGNTVYLQASGGIFKIASWADFINAHALPGPGIIEGLKKACLEVNRPDVGLLLLAEMTSRGNLITDEYQHQTIEMAKQYPHFVAGWDVHTRIIIFITSSSVTFLNIQPVSCVCVCVRERSNPLSPHIIPKQTVKQSNSIQCVRFKKNIKNTQIQ